MADKVKPTDIDIETMTTTTKEQIDPCLNCDTDTTAMCDYPCNAKIRYIYWLEKKNKKQP